MTRLDGGVLNCCGLIQVLYECLLDHRSWGKVVVAGLSMDLGEEVGSLDGGRHLAARAFLSRRRG